MAGRPERGLQDDGTPLVRLALGLRDLRRAAGSPSYRAMSLRVHRSQTTLSEAAGGERVPTWDTVEAYVEACGGDLSGWRERWEAAAGRPAEREQGPVVPLVVVPPAPDGGDGPEVGLAATGGGRGRRRWLWPAAAVACAVAGLAVGYLVGSASGGADQAAATPREQPPTVAVRDGSDPQDTGCSRRAGEGVLDTTEVSYDGRPAGVVELRYSPACGAAWSRFVPFDDDVVPAGVVVHTDVVRPSPDGTGAEERFGFSAEHVVGEETFGNQAVSTSSCVLAAVSLQTPAGESPESRTHCFRGATFVR